MISIYTKLPEVEFFQKIFQSIRGIITQPFPPPTPLRISADKLDRSNGNREATGKAIALVAYAAWRFNTFHTVREDKPTCFPIL